MIFKWYDSQMLWRRPTWGVRPYGAELASAPKMLDTDLHYYDFILVVGTELNGLNNFLDKGSNESGMFVSLQYNHLGMARWSYS
jgi:hypothetical protein